ncbi:MAG TPA: glutaredoxin family protein [Steroidobacteraceae bacterium]
MTLPAGLVVLSRDGCHLCEQMLEDLAALEREGRIPACTLIDVDSDADLARQYGLKVPVLLLDGSVICHYTLNSQELLRLVARAPAILPR